MTLKERIISENENFFEILVKNNNDNYIFMKKKHKWHDLEISKLMKKNINLFLKKDTKIFFLNLQNIAKRQIEIKSYLEKLRSENNAIFKKMFKSKYYEEQKENMLKAELIIKEHIGKELKDFFNLENNIRYISNEYLMFLIDNKWFETICFYLIRSLNINSRLYLDVDIKIDGENKQIDNLIITKDLCAIIECKSGETFTEAEISKIKVYKAGLKANLGIILRCRDKVEYSLKEEIVGVYIIDGIFSKKPSEIKKKLLSILNR